MTQPVDSAPADAALAVQLIKVQLLKVSNALGDSPWAKNFQLALNATATKLGNVAVAMVASAPKPKGPKPKTVDTDNDEHIRACATKTRYRTADRALVVASERPVPLRVYQCPCCHGFHLTKNTDPLKQSRHEEEGTP